MLRISEFLKSIMFLLLFITILPFLIKTIKEQYGNLIKEKTKVGIVPFKKVLKDSEPYIKNLTEFFKNPSIKAVILKMDCGGGAAGTSQTIFNEILALKKKYPKPVIVFVENVCASGAYYIACAADTIIASPSAFVGSIGVYIPHPELKEFIEQFKVKYSVIKTGTYKTVGDPFLQDTPEQRALLQSLTNSTYEQFIKDVAENRTGKLALSNASTWAEGKIFTGTQALPLGLVDKIGSPSTVEDDLRTRIAIVGEIDWIKAPEPSRFAQLFSETEADSFAGFIAEKIVQAVGNPKTLQAHV